MTGSGRKGEHLVPHIPYPVSRRDIEVLRQQDCAIQRGDWRTAASLKLESAHEDMVRRDAKLSELVADVQAGYAEGVQHAAKSLIEWDRLFVREVNTATEWAARASTPEAER
jgi:hypothetical protein